MGGGSSSTSTVRKRDPESAELKNLQTGIYNLLAPLLGLQASGTGADAGVGSGAVGGTGTGSSGSSLGRTYTTTYDSSNGVPWYEWYDPANTIPDSYYGYDGDGNYNPYRDQSLRGNTMQANTNTSKTSSNAAANAAANEAADWAATQFGKTWNDLQGRSDEALRAYDAAVAAEPGLQNNILNTTDQIARLSGTAQAALQPNIDRINNNSSLISGIGNQLAALAPEAQAALQPNINNMNTISGKLAGLGDTINGASSGYATESGTLNKKIEGVGDRQGNLATTMWNFTESGNIPEEMKRNLMATVNNELRTNTGSALNDLAARGVMNSSVANRSINNLSNAAADAYAQNYLNAYNSVLGGYGKTNDTLASQADTYAKVRAGLDSSWNNQLQGYDAARNAWNSALGGYENANNQISQGYNSRINALNNAGTQYQNAINGYNIANNNINTGYNNALSGLNTALGGYQQAYTNNQNKTTNMAAMPQTLAQSSWSQYQPVYDFWKTMRNSYDSKEDYDTVVKQGK